MKKPKLHISKYRIKVFGYKTRKILSFFALDNIGKLSASTKAMMILLLLLAITVSASNINFGIKTEASAWSIQTVDSTGSVGTYTSIALDSNNNPRISYYDSVNNDLKYASWNGSAWSIQTVDSTGSVGTYTSIALDSNNNPRISYYDTTDNDLKYASIPSGGMAGTTEITNNYDFTYQGVSVHVRAQNASNALFANTATARQGDTVRFTLTVNNPESAAKNVDVKFTLPAGFNYNGGLAYSGISGCTAALPAVGANGPMSWTNCSAQAGDRTISFDTIVP